MNVLTRQEAEDFLYHEAQLLDERRLEAWLELFAEDGIFWIPITDDGDPKREPSILYDDGALRAARVYQLLHQPHYAQLPASRTIHYITNVQVMGANDDGNVVVLCNLSVTEMRPGDHQERQYGLGRQRTLAGRCEYHLRERDGGWAIALKKVILIDCDLPIHNLSFIL